MIWATVSSWSCFGWLYRASPSLAAKNIVSLISIIDHLVMSMYRVFSCDVGRGCLLWPVCSLGKTLPCFILYSKAKFACYSWYLLASLPLWYLCPYARKQRRTKEPLDNTERGECKSWLKTQHSETKIMASGPITSWQIDDKTVKTVTDFIFGGLQNHCR